MVPRRAGAFLAGHGFWVVAFLQRGLHPVQAVAGALGAMAVLAHDRFVRPRRHGHLAVMITYHLAQFLLLLGLLHRG